MLEVGIVAGLILFIIFWGKLCNWLDRLEGEAICRAGNERDARLAKIAEQHVKRLGLEDSLSDPRVREIWAEIYGYPRVSDQAGQKE